MRGGKSRTIHAISRRFWIKELLILSALLMVVFDFERIGRWLQPLIGTEKAAVEWAPLYELAGQYLLLVLGSSAAAFLVAFVVGAAVCLFRMTDVKELLLTVGGFGTTFPTTAVIALLVPILGYGFLPVLVALVLYGIFPILINTINGLEQVDPIVKNAAEGIGMSRFQQFRSIELPLAKPMILAGIRTSFIINIAAATVGSVVGAGGLGMPIVSGIRTDDPVLILKGALPVALIALLADRLFNRWETSQSWRIRNE